MRKLVIEVVEAPDGYRAVAKAETRQGYGWFHGSAKSLVGAAESALESIRNERRPFRRGRRPRRYKVAQALL